MRVAVFAAIALMPALAFAQGGTQSRNGLGSVDNHPTTGSDNSVPSGSLNAETGPQSRPAYPSGSDTANPGAAFVKTTPVPATGPAGGSVGEVTTNVGPDGATRSTGAGVGQAGTPPP